MSKVSVKDDPNTTKFEHLSEFITAIANNNNEDATKHIQEYVNIKAKEVIQGIREDAKGKHHADTDEDDDKDDTKHLSNRDKKVDKPTIRKMKKEVDESVIQEFIGDDSPIKLKGDDVFVEGKLVGTLKNDLNDAEAGITFKSTDGKLGEEFDNMKELYSFLMGKFSKEGADLE